MAARRLYPAALVYSDLLNTLQYRRIQQQQRAVNGRYNMDGVMTSGPINALACLFKSAQIVSHSKWHSWPIKRKTGQQRIRFVRLFFFPSSSLNIIFTRSLMQRRIFYAHKFIFIFFPSATFWAFSIAQRPSKIFLFLFFNCCHMLCGRSKQPRPACQRHTRI